MGYCGVLLLLLLQCSLSNRANMPLLFLQVRHPGLCTHGGKNEVKSLPLTERYPLPTSTFQPNSKLLDNRNKAHNKVLSLKRLSWDKLADLRPYQCQYQKPAINQWNLKNRGKRGHSLLVPHIITTPVFHRDTSSTRKLELKL